MFYSGSYLYLNLLYFTHIVCYTNQAGSTRWVIRVPTQTCIFKFPVFSLSDRKFALFVTIAYTLLHIDFADLSSLSVF